MQFYTIEDFKDKLQNQKVFVRVDTNTTLENGEMPLTSRIEQALETINKLTSYGAAVVVGAHNGRSGETSFVSLGPLFSLLQKQNPSQSRQAGRSTGSSSTASPRAKRSPAPPTWLASTGRPKAAASR